MMVEMQKDVDRVGLSEATLVNLKELESDGIFGDAIDGYKLAVSLAIFLRLDFKSHELVKQQPMYHAHVIDQDQQFKVSISTLFPDAQGIEYRTMQKLADLGVELIYSNVEESGNLDLNEIMK